MNSTHRHSALFAALSSLVALAAGVGVWAALRYAAPLPWWLVIPTATALVAGLLLYMLGTSQQAGRAAGLAGAQLDPVTRLPSQLVARQLLLREFAAAERGRPLTIVLFTLDNLPRMAATKGAAEANRVLLGVGAILKRRTRGMNMSARLDEGHTFISILGGVEEIGAEKFVAKVTKDLASLKASGPALEVRVGVCGYEPSLHTADDLLVKAHAALIEADNYNDDLLIA